MVHAVIPHHHHESDVCFVNSHCDIETKVHDHNTQEHNHEHDHEHHNDTKSEPCVLNQVVVIPANILRLEFKYIDFQDINCDLDQYQAILYDSKTGSNITSHYTVIKRPILSSAYFNFLSSGLSLRAPPIV